MSGLCTLGRSSTRTRTFRDVATGVDAAGDEEEALAVLLKALRGRGMAAGGPALASPSGTKMTARALSFPRGPSFRSLERLGRPPVRRESALAGRGWVGPGPLGGRARPGSGSAVLPGSGEEEDVGAGASSWGQARLSVKQLGGRASWVSTSSGSCESGSGCGSGSVSRPSCCCPPGEWAKGPDEPRRARLADVSRACWGAGVFTPGAKVGWADPGRMEEPRRETPWLWRGARTLQG